MSISAALPREAREQLVAYYQRYYSGTAGLAESNRPFQYFAAPPSFGELDAGAAFDVLKANLAGLRANYLLHSQRSPNPFDIALLRDFKLPAML